MFGPQVASDDVLQDTFLALVRNAGRIREPGMVRNYLYTVARRIAMLERRRVTRRERHWFSLQNAAASSPADQDATATLTTLKSSLQRLSARRQAVLILCCVEGRSVSEASALLGISSATLQRELRVARRYVVRWMASGERRDDLP